MNSKLEMNIPIVNDNLQTEENGLWITADENGITIRVIIDGFPEYSLSINNNLYFEFMSDEKRIHKIDLEKGYFEKYNKKESFKCHMCSYETDDEDCIFYCDECKKPTCNVHLAFIQHQGYEEQICVKCLPRPTKPRESEK